MPLPSREQLSSIVSNMFPKPAPRSNDQQQQPQQRQQPQNQQQPQNRQGQQPNNQGQRPGTGKISDQNGIRYGGPADGNQQQQDDGQGNENAESPFAAFDTMLENMGSEQSEEAPAFKLDPKQLQDAVATMDFTSSLPKDLLAKFNGMGEQGQMFLDAINHVGRSAYSQSLQHGTALTDKFVGMRSAHDQKRLGRDVRQHVVRNSLKTGESQEHPLVASMRQTLADQLADRFPDATPEWIDKQTRSFFVNSARQLSPDAFEALEGGGQGGRQPEAEDVNWDDWIENKPQQQRSQGRR